MGVMVTGARYLEGFLEVTGKATVIAETRTTYEGEPIYIRVPNPNHLRG